MRNKIVAGNWKMNTTPIEGIALVSEVLDLLKDFDLSGKKVVFGTPMVSIAAVASLIGQSSNIQVASQNISSFDNGAYTGETSADMLVAVGATMAIIGHSERREYFNETNRVLATKVSKALAKELTPIYCCGEVLKDRQNGTYESFIKAQVEEGLFHLNPEQMSSIVIAYEPVWAIGTGETATPEQAQEVHSFIRNLIVSKYGFEIADNMSILYGGSMKPANAKKLMSKDDIDGGLIGGASLKSKDFFSIIQAM
ncbi:MAG: triosephosphate isomerase [Salibacteraceae bacterium]|jgi:triosephosphate isomerase